MRQFRPFVAVLGIAVLSFLAGCGGGGSAAIGGSTGGATTGGASNPVNNATATIRVDLNSRQVTITPLNGANAKVFQGNRIGFNSSLVLDEPGDVGRKVLKVSLVNHSAESVGIDPNGNMNGLQVVFGAFSNTSSIPDLRPQTQVSTFAGTGVTGSADGANASATFDHPTTVATDQYGHIYVGEVSRIRKILLTGGANPNLSGSYAVYAFAGSGTPGFADGIGANAQFWGPNGIAVDPSGNVYVADQFNHRIRFIGAGAEVVTIAGTGTAADADGTGDVATINSPSGIAFYKGALFISEAGGNRIREMIPNSGAPLAN